MLRGFVGFGIQVDFRLTVYELVTADVLAVTFQLSVAAVEYQIRRALPFKSDAINRTLVRGGIVYIDIVVVQIYLVTVRMDLLMIVAVIDNRLQSGFFPLIRAQVEGGASAVAGHDDRQPAQHVTRKVGTLRINTEHAVR